MHDLNDALDELRHVIPYAHSPSVRKLSKIATLLLAKNFILMQANALGELRRMLICLHQHSGDSLPQPISASVVAIVNSSGALLTKAGQQHSRASHLVGGHNGGNPMTMGSNCNNGTGTRQDSKSSSSGMLSSSSSAMPGGCDDPQAISVQNRRRKYNMLINRILGL